jgi:hypothetical protein
MNPYRKVDHRKGYSANRYNIGKIHQNRLFIADATVDDASVNEATVNEATVDDASAKQL